MSQQPSAQLLSSLHQRLLAGDPVASAELAKVAITPLARALELGNHGLRDENMAYESAIDAIIEFAKAPHVYRPGPAGIWSFLKMAGRRNLANLLLKERRQGGRIIRFADVVLHDPARKRMSDGILADLAEAERQATDRQQLDAATTTLSGIEIAAFRLMVDGIRATEAFARVMGIDHKPAKEQRREVKQLKDRLLKRLKRALQERQDE